MSLFLGKIHYWLFNKILWFEKLERDIVDLAKNEGLDTQKLKEQIESKYGEPLKDEPLEAIIDTNNIHGWLQDKIHSAEKRMAAWTKILLDLDESNYTKLEEIYKKQAIIAAKEAKNKEKEFNKAKSLFDAINDYILDGMPCDRVNEVISNEDDKIEWIQTVCVHRDIWEEVGANVNYFYRLRDTWIRVFVDELNQDFEYEVEVNGVRTINKKRLSV